MDVGRGVAVCGVLSDKVDWGLECCGMGWGGWSGLGRDMVLIRWMGWVAMGSGAEGGVVEWGLVGEEGREKGCGGDDTQRSPSLYTPQV